MPHYIRRCQTANLDILHAVQYADGLLQTADFVARQVNLRDIAGNDDFRAEAEACQKHLHLLACGVLCFVENDKAVVQCPPAHICQRRNLNISALKILSIRLRPQHIEQRVVKWTQVGVNLVLQIAR